MWQTVVGILVTALLGAALYRSTKARQQDRQRMPEHVLGGLRSVVDNAEIGAAETEGVYQLTGSYKGAPVAIKAVTDLLMLRKLPSLWLMVTLPGPTQAPAKLDMMMRPAGQSSFSNFDFLPLTFPAPAGYPEQAVLRSDDADAQALVPLLAQHRQLLGLNRLKEILVAPEGLRVVTLLAEGARARYGVYRQADFGECSASPDEVRLQLDLLLALKESLAK